MTRTGLAVGVAIVALIVVGSTFGALPVVRAVTSAGNGGLPASSAAGSAGAAIVPLARLPPSALDGTGLSAGEAPPSGFYYLQEGADYMAENGSAVNEFSVLSETFSAVSSPYSTPGTSATGYELNGVTSAGDWIQMVVGDNWPIGFTQCDVPTFDLFYETWNDTGTSVAGPSWVESGACSQMFDPAPGDLLELSMSLNCPTGGPGSVCMTYSDLTQGLSTTVIEIQPEYAADGIVSSSFQNWPNPSSLTNGYFIGPATEVLEQAHACPTFAMSPVSYTLNSPNGLAVTEFNAWSDEWVPSADYLCSPLSDSVGALGDAATTSFVQSASTTSLGAHWLGAQNWSAASAQILGTPAPGETRFETDPVPWALSVEVDGSDASPVVVDGGPTYDVQGVVSGGSPSGVVCTWTVNGLPYVPGPPTCSWSWPATQAGSAVFAALAVDSTLNAEANSTTLVVNPGPAVTLVASQPQVDQDQLVTFTAAAGGGVPPYSYAWAGLPAPCSGTSTSSSVNCTPTVPGNYTVEVTVTDAFGFSGASSPLAFGVAPPCTGETCYPVTFRVVGNAPADWEAGVFVNCLPCRSWVAVAAANSSGTGTAEFDVPNGTYAFLLRGGPGERVVGTEPVGNLTVNGSAVNLTVGFAKGSTATVAFSSAGLPKGTLWCVVLGWTWCTTAGTVSLAGLTAGSYPYAIQSVEGYSARTQIAGALAPSSGTVSVVGHTTHIRTIFTQETYPVTFTETGLATGKGWSVKVVGVFHGRTKTESRSSKRGTIVFEVPNGTFTYTVKTGPGYNSSGPGTVDVRGLPVNVSVTFERATPAVPRAALSPTGGFLPVVRSRAGLAAPFAATAALLALLRWPR